MNTPDPIVTHEGQPGAGAPAPGPSDLGLRPQLAPYLLTPLTWLDLFLLAGFYIVGGAVIYLLVSATASLIFHIPLSASGDLGSHASLLIVTQAVLSVATMAFLYVIIRVRTWLPFWPAVGWRRLPESAYAFLYVGLGAGLSIAAGAADQLVHNGKTLPIEALFTSRQTVILLTALGVLVAPFVEETLFRGCIFPVIARRFGTMTGVLVTGVLFGLAHAEQLWGGWGEIGVLITVGIVLTYIRARTGTVLASYLVHLGYNTVLFTLFYAATGGLHHLPGT